MTMSLRLPSLSSMAQSLWKHKWINAPFLIANILLIGLISYGLIKDNELSEDEKKNLSYAEIAVSFIGSSIVLLVYCIFILMSVSGIWDILTRTHLYGRTDSITGIVVPLLVVSSLLLLTPFTITVLRVGLNTKLSGQQKNIMAGITIPSALWSIYLTPLLLGIERL